MKDKDTKALEMLMEEVYDNKIQIFKKLDAIPETYRTDEDQGGKPGIIIWTSFYHMAGKDEIRVETIYDKFKNIFSVGYADDPQGRKINFTPEQSDKMFKLIYDVLELDENDIGDEWAVSYE